MGMKVSSPSTSSWHLRHDSSICDTRWYASRCSSLEQYSMKTCPGPLWGTWPTKLVRLPSTCAAASVSWKLGIMWRAKAIGTATAREVRTLVEMVRERVSELSLVLLGADSSVRQSVHTK